MKCHLAMREKSLIEKKKKFTRWILPGKQNGRRRRKKNGNTFFSNPPETTIFKIFCKTKKEKNSHSSVMLSICTKRNESIQKYKQINMYALEKDYLVQLNDYLSIVK